MLPTTSVFEFLPSRTIVRFPISLRRLRYVFLENEGMLDELEMEDIRNNDSLMGSINVGH
jgi:hypothetical protein